MYRTLLVHNDNTPLQQKIERKIPFRPTVDELSSGNIDKYISDEIIPQIKVEDFDMVFIKDTLSENYIDFYGLVLAYHIRLSSELEDKRNVPIVILSEINSYTINKLSKLGQILFTKNVFLSENTIDTVEKFEYLQPTFLSDEEYQYSFLNRIEVEPPKDYLSHHSITNEWAIHQWSQLLGVHTSAIQKNENKINTMLYFKYLVSKYHLTQKDEMPDQIKKKSGRVLLIDDKCDEGWHDVLDGFMRKNYSNVTFSSLGRGFKDIKEIDTIEEKVKTKIDEFDPDIILLDLRLMDESDSQINIKDDEKKISEISGIQILRYIKGKQFNQGIQIIVFSASTDSLVLDEVYRQGVLGYVKKDSPINKYMASKNSVSKLKQLISGKDGGFEKKYLKEIWNLQEEMLVLPFLTNSKDAIIFELRESVSSVFDILNSNMPSPYKYAMLAIFRSMELICDFYIEEKYDHNKKYAYWKNANRKIKTLDNNILKDTESGDYNLSIENKIRAIIQKQSNLTGDGINNQIKQIVCSRNYAIHSQEKERCRTYLIKELRAEHILGWFEMLSKIIMTLKN